MKRLRARRCADAPQLLSLRASGTRSSAALSLATRLPAASSSLKTVLLTKSTRPSSPSVSLRKALSAKRSRRVDPSCSSPS